jgi:hypothetical protein
MQDMESSRANEAASRRDSDLDSQRHWDLDSRGNHDKFVGILFRGRQITFDPRNSQHDSLRAAYINESCVTSIWTHGILKYDVTNYIIMGLGIYIIREKCLSTFSSIEAIIVDKILMN